MNKVFQIFEEEKQEAINETRIEAKLEEKQDFAEKLLSDGVEIVKIMKYTGLTKKQIEAVKERLSVSNF